VVPPPRETALGSLVNYICHTEARNFQPANITFDLLPQLDEVMRRKIRDKKQRHKMVCDLAMQALESWLAQCSAAAALQNPEIISAACSFWAPILLLCVAGS